MIQPRLCVICSATPMPTTISTMINDMAPRALMAVKMATNSSTATKPTPSHGAGYIFTGRELMVMTSPNACVINAAKAA